jgi:hypothetical protein
VLVRACNFSVFWGYTDPVHILLHFF